jgi:hypothetical protein
VSASTMVLVDDVSINGPTLFAKSVYTSVDYFQ